MKNTKVVIRSQKLLHYISLSKKEANQLYKSLAIRLVSLVEIESRLMRVLQKVL